MSPHAPFQLAPLARFVAAGAALVLLCTLLAAPLSAQTDPTLNGWSSDFPRAEIWYGGKKVEEERAPEATRESLDPKAGIDSIDPRLLRTQAMESAAALRNAPDEALSANPLTPQLQGPLRGGPDSLPQVNITTGVEHLRPVADTALPATPPMRVSPEPPVANQQRSTEDRSAAHLRNAIDQSPYTVDQSPYAGDRGVRSESPVPADAGPVNVDQAAFGYGVLIAGVALAASGITAFCLASLLGLYAVRRLSQINVRDGEPAATTQVVLMPNEAAPTTSTAAAAPFGAAAEVKPEPAPEPPNNIASFKDMVVGSGDEEFFQDTPLSTVQPPDAGKDVAADIVQGMVQANLQLRKSLA